MLLLLLLLKVWYEESSGREYQKQSGERERVCKVERTVTEIRRSSARDTFMPESVYLALNSLWDWEPVGRLKQSDLVSSTFVLWLLLLSLRCLIFVCLFVCLFVCFCLFVCLFVCLFLFVFVCLFVCFRCCGFCCFFMCVCGGGGVLGGCVWGGVHACVGVCVSVSVNVSERRVGGFVGSMVVRFLYGATC